MYQNNQCLLFRVNPLAISLALNLSMVRSTFIFILKIHLQPIGLDLGGSSTSFQVLLPIIEFISSWITSFQKAGF